MFKGFGMSVRILAATLLLATAAVPSRAIAQARAMIEHIEPTSGPPGTRVQIVGRGFRPGVRVLFNEHEVPIRERLPERLAIELPANAQTGRFVVAHGADEVESAVFQVTAPEPPPRVTAIEPTSAGPGSEVVIRGANFAARTTDNQVRIGTQPMVVRSGDPTALRVIVPDGAQSGPITVHTAGGDAQSPPLTVAARVLVRDFAPLGASPGGHVVIRGSGFSATPAQDHVTVGGRAVRVVRATASEIEIEIPRDAQQGGAIVVEVPGAGRVETGGQLRVAPAPLITAVDPPQAAAGARIALRGERFGSDVNAVQVTLGETTAQVITVGPNEVVVQVPRGGASASRWNVTVGGIGPVQSPADFTVLEPVSVTAFSPRAGDVGDQVTITGTGFSPNAAENTVRLGTIVARVISATSHEIVAEVPSGRSGPWAVTVAGNGEGRSHDPFMITLRPRITSLDPDHGIVGARVTLHGEHFPADRALVQVRLQDVECNVESVSHEGIVVMVPRGVQPGPARFSVVARLQGTGHAEMDFHVLVPTTITALDPPAAPVGAHVIVRGEGFEVDPRQLHVHLGTLVLRPTNLTTTSFEFVVPPHATTGEITVQAAQRQDATAHFTLQVPPVVQSFAPATGRVGAHVTLRGRNFGADAAAVHVMLGEVACTVTAVTPTAISVDVPDSAASGRFVVTVQDQGDGRAPRDFRVTGGSPTHGASAPTATGAASGAPAASGSPGSVRH